MGLSLTAFTGAATVATSDILDRVGIIETWLNGGIVAGDLASGRWLTSEHVQRPTFTTAPEPTARFVSGEVHTTHTPHNLPEGSLLYHDIDTTNTMVVEGLSRTFYVPSGVHQATVWCSFYAYEFGSDGVSVTGAEDDLAATFKLYRSYGQTIDALSGTACYLYGATDHHWKSGGHRFARKLFTIVRHIPLTTNTGQMNTISVRVKLTKPSNPRSWFKIWTLARTMVISLEAL